MNKPLRILNLEDNFSDAELFKFELEEAGFTLTTNVVSKKDDFISALQEFEPDIILSDYDLPRYNGAMALADAKRICPEVPFILVTGAVSEDRAIQILTSGAKDYVMKNRINRLVPAVKRVLAEAEEHKARKKAEEELRKAHAELEAKVSERTAALEAKIEEHKRTEKALRESEERYQKFFENSIDAILITALDGSIFSANKAACRMFGMTEQEILDAGRAGVVDIFDPRLKTALEERNRTGSFKGELRFKRKDGAIFSGEISTTLFTDHNGQIRTAMIIRDFTESKRAEEELREKEAELQMIADMTPIILNRCSRDLRFNFANKACCNFFQKAREEIVGKKIIDVLGRPALETILPYIEKVLQGETVTYKTEIPYKNAGSRFMYVTYTPEINNQNDVIGWFASVVDITDLMRAEEALGQSEQWLAMAAGTTGIGIFQSSSVTGDILANEQFGYLIGLQPKLKAISTALSQHYDKDQWTERIHPSDWPDLRMKIDACQSQRCPLDAEFRCIDLEGKERWLNVRGTFQDDEQGKATNFLGVIIDITESKKDRQAQELLSALMDHSPSLAFLKDECGKYVYVNKTYIEQFDLPQEWFGKTDFDFWPKKSAELFRANDADILQSGKTRQFLEDSVDLAGNRHCWLCYKFVFTDSESRPYLGGIGIDAINRVRAEEAQQESEARLQLALDAAEMGTFVWFPQEDRGVYDERTMAIFGLGQDNSVNLAGKLRKIMHPDDFSLHTAAVMHALDPVGGGMLCSEFRIRRLNDSTERWISVLGKAQFAGNLPVIVSITGVCTDITERKEMEMALRRTKDELEAFSYSVSHDLRAPLRAINGYSRMILKRKGDEFDEETKRQFNQVRKSAKTMDRLINDLLALSKSGRQDLVLKSLNIRRIIKQAWEGLQNDNPDRKMTLKINNPIIPVLGDEGLIQQVVVNLLANAVKFTKTRDTALIEAGSYERDQESVYYVKDNGIGFDMQYHDKLFGTFQRLHDANEYEGTGIGMALVKRIIHRHGGQVWAESEVDKGATFYFSLPKQSIQAKFN